MKKYNCVIRNSDYIHVAKPIAYFHGVACVGISIENANTGENKGVWISLKDAQLLAKDLEDLHYRYSEIKTGDSVKFRDGKLDGIYKIVDIVDLDNNTYAKLEDQSNYSFLKLLYPLALLEKVN